MPWGLDELGRSDEVDMAYAEGQALPRNLSKPTTKLDPALWPVREFIAPDCKNPVIPDYTKGPAIGVVVVSAAFRQLVESLDPLPHHFIPLHITFPDGRVQTDTHFIFKLGQFVEGGIIPEQSEIRVNMWQGEVSHYGATTLSPRLMWRAEAVAGRHIWADRHLPATVVVSDTLFARMKAQNMTGFLAIEGRIA